MDRREILSAIAQADEDAIEDILTAAMKRKQ